MKIEIKKENYKQLIQCIYLGNLIINEYREGAGCKNEYADFVGGVLIQVIRQTPKPQSKFAFKKFPNEKTEDTLMSDLLDRIEDSVKEYYEDYRHSLFCEMLADKIADRNYPVIGNSEVDAFDNLLAKKFYYEILNGGCENFVHIEAPEICNKIRRAKI